MKILLIVPSVGFYAGNRGLSNPVGLLSIGTYLKQNGHDVKIYDRCLDTTKIDDVINDFSPDIFGISVISSRGLKDAIKISKYIKETSGKPVVWGGPLPSIQIDLVLANDYVDIVSFGEGEETWKELADCYENNKPIDDILGIAYKKDGKIVINPCRPFSDLRDMPIADWSLIDVPKYMQTYLGCKRMMHIYSSKGCPCKCAFCNNVVFHKSTHRKRPNEHVIEEIKYLIDNYGLDGVYFTDELWVTKKSDMQDFCRRVHENHLNFHWGLEARIGMFNEEDYQAMYDAGCRWILFGIETGSLEMSKRIHKNIDLEKVKPTVDTLKKIGITPKCTFIIGFPDETVEQLRDTVKLINSVDADLSVVSHLTPLPGTEIYDEVVSQGRYPATKSLEDLAKEVTGDSIVKNLSTVPTKDLLVIRGWYLWKGFTKNSSAASGKSFEFAKETVLNGLRSISSKGPIFFFVNGFKALHDFLYVFWYSHAYPDIVKKYNLKK